MVAMEDEVAGQDAGGAVSVGLEVGEGVCISSPRVLRYVIDVDLVSGKERGGDAGLSFKGHGLGIVVAAKGGGAVEVTVSGKKEITSVFHGLRGFTS